MNSFIARGTDGTPIQQIINGGSPLNGFTTLAIPSIAAQFTVDLTKGVNYSLSLQFGEERFESAFYWVTLTSNLTGLIASEDVSNKTPTAAAFNVYIPPTAGWSSAGAGAGKPGTSGWVTLSLAARGIGWTGSSAAPSIVITGPSVIPVVPPAYS